MGYRRKSKAKKIVEIIIFLIIAAGIGYSFISMDESLDIVETKVEKLSEPSFKSIAGMKKSVENMSADEAEDVYLKYQQQLMQ